MNIKNVVVIGSGTMGSGIAAQLCNANIPVTLLDLKTEISEKAKKKIFESRPPLLIDKRFNELKNRQTLISEFNLKRFMGSDQLVLIEGPSKKNKDKSMGRTDGNIIVILDKKCIKFC